MCHIIELAECLSLSDQAECLETSPCLRPLRPEARIVCRVSMVIPEAPNDRLPE